jgi:hypothetical protein
MTTGSEALLLAATMVLVVVVVSFWPGIMNGSVFLSLGFAGVSSVPFAIR